jgi:hypothetical protein
MNVWSSRKCLGIVNSLWEMMKAWRKDLGYVEGEN